MKKTWKMFVGFLGAAVLFVQPIMAAEAAFVPNLEQSRAIVSALNIGEHSLRVEPNRLRAVRLLVESNRKLEAQSSYQLEGTVFTKQTMIMEGEEPIISDTVLDMKVAFEDPDTIYMKAVTGVLDEVYEVDIFFENGLMHIKTDEEDWFAFSDPNSLILVSDTTKLLTVEQIKTLFNETTYVEEEIVDGNRFHAITVEISGERFKEIMQGDVAALQALVNSFGGFVNVTDSMDATIQYVYKIDADTLQLAEVQYRMEINFAMDIDGREVVLHTVSAGIVHVLNDIEEGILDEVRSIF